MYCVTQDISPRMAARNETHDLDIRLDGHLRGHLGSHFGKRRQAFRRLTWHCNAADWTERGTVRLLNRDMEGVLDRRLGPMARCTRPLALSAHSLRCPSGVRPPEWSYHR